MNLRCVEGVDLEGVEIRRFDGRNWEEAHAATRGPAVP